MQRYKEYAGIYKVGRQAPEFSSALTDPDTPRTLLVLYLQEEEEERSDRWKHFLERQPESSGQVAGDNAQGGGSESLPEKTSAGPRKIEIWTPIRKSLGNIEQMMSLRVEKKQSSAGKQQVVRGQADDGIHPVKVEEAKLSEDSDDEFYDVDKVDPSQEVHSGDTGNADNGSRGHEETYISKEELECLVHGGLPMALRGEVQSLRTEAFYFFLLLVIYSAHSATLCICIDSYGKPLLVLELVG